MLFALQEDVGFGGLKTLDYINNILNAGVEINSGYYGFPLIYDLLVGTVPLKLHPSDRTHNWGRMLVRLLPSTDFAKKSAEMSALRLLADNPTIAMHQHIPKFQIDSAMNKFKGMFQGKDAVSRLLEQLHSFFIKESIRNLIKMPEVRKTFISQPQINLRPPESLSAHRLWVVPNVTDYSQSQFELDIQNCASVNIPAAQLKAFSRKPLSPINLGNFVEHLSRSQCGLPLLSGALPFDIRKNRACRTHSSESTIQRLTSDVRKYAEKTNAETIPTLIGFSPSNLESMQRSSEALHKAHSQLSSLVKALNESMYFDRKSLSNLMQRALAIATSDERSDKPYSNGMEGECNFLKFRLGQCSEREPSAWFELLVASLLSTTAEYDIRSLNPFLTSTAYKTVNSLTVVAMLTSIRISQTHRALTR